MTCSKGALQTGGVAIPALSSSLLDDHMSNDEADDGSHPFGRGAGKGPLPLEEMQQEEEVKEHEQEKEQKQEQGTKKEAKVERELPTTPKGTQTISRVGDGGGEGVEGGGVLRKAGTA
jgi:hypothetical protein